jgi:DNA-binding MarR family transcriptional regulator
MVSKQLKTLTDTASEPVHSLTPATSCAPSVDFYCPDDYKPNDSVGYLMRRIISLVSQGIERELEPAGLTNAQWVPLLKLQMGMASTVAELARECDLDAGSMTRLLDRLEAKDLCRRVRSLEDRRVVNLELTDAGRVAAKEIPVVLCRLQNQLLDGFSPDEWLVLRGLLGRILDTAQTLPSITGQAVPAPAEISDSTSSTTPSTGG